MPLSYFLEISNPVESATNLTGESLDSVVVFHCDDKEFNNSLQVLQFLPPCVVGAWLNFLPSEYYFAEPWWNDTDPVVNYVTCMKMQTRLSRNSHKRSPGKHGNKAEKSPSCKILLEQNEKLKFEFQWRYFESPEQYLIPLGVVVGTIVLTGITGTIWDCVRKKKKNNCASKRGTCV